MRCQLTPAPALPTAAAAVSSFLLEFAEQRSRPVSFEALLQLHLILDRLHAADGAR